MKLVVTPSCCLKFIFGREHWAGSSPFKHSMQLEKDGLRRIGYLESQAAPYLGAGVEVECHMSGFSESRPHHEYWVPPFAGKIIDVLDGWDNDENETRAIRVIERIADDPVAIQLVANGSDDALRRFADAVLQGG